jgi:hypothetical protein
MYRTTQSLIKSRTRQYSSSAVVRSGLGARSTETTVEQTVLEGNVKVISVDSPSATSTVSLFVKAGSRFENRLNSGASHFLTKLAYRVCTVSFFD